MDGTRHLVEAACALDEPPMFIECSSSAVYGSRNPHRHADRLNAQTPINPVDCYGEHKVASEHIVASSGLPHATLRLGGVLSSSVLKATGNEGAVLARAVPYDNRIHMVDARDVALAFANAVDRAEQINGKILMIAGDETNVLRQGQMMDAVMEAMGIGRLGTATSLPGDPDDDHGWFLTDWFDTTESQSLLQFQQHTWQETIDDIAAALGRRRMINTVLGPVIRFAMRRSAAKQLISDGRGQYADPWKLIEAHYGSAALANAGD